MNDIVADAAALADARTFNRKLAWAPRFKDTFASISTMRISSSGELLGASRLTASVRMDW
jgi:hypothetical protein